MEDAMKTFVSILNLTFLILFSVSVFAQNTLPTPKKINQEQIMQSLLMGTCSGNKGLCAGCTYMLGELCCKKSVVPLMAILHNSPCEEIRILAALSLTKIGDARGLYAVKRAITFDDSERVRRMCSIFFRASLAGEVKSESKAQFAIDE